MHPQTNTENQLRRITGILKALRSVNRLVVVEKNTQNIIQKVCTILVETREYHNVWIALIDEKSVLLNFAQAGLGIEADKLNQRLLNQHLPTCVSDALNNSGPIVINNPAKKCPDCPLSMKYANRSAFTFPLINEGSVLGVISASVPAEFANSEEEIELFTEMASDIAFCLSKIELNKKINKTEETLFEYINNFENIVGSMFETLSVLDADGVFLFANENCAKNMTGFSDPLKVTGRNITEFLPPDQSNALIKKYQSVVETNETIKQELRISTIKGDKWFLNALKPILFGQDKIKAIQSVSMDITNLKQSEIAANESESKYKNLVEALNDALFILQDGLIKYVNPKLIRISEYNEEELLNKDFTLFIPTEEMEQVLTIYHKRLRGEKGISQFESVIISKSGKHIDIEVTATPVGFSGKPAFQVVLKDISAQKKATQALIDSEEKFRFFSKSTFEGIIVHKNGIVVDVNDAFVKISGYTRAEAIGKNLLNYLPNPLDKAKVVLNMVKQKAKPYIVTSKRKDGSTFIAELEAKNVKHLGEIVRIAAVRDVTERHILQKQILENERKMITLMENLPGMVYRCKNLRSWTMEFLNDGCIKLTGYKPSELINNAAISYSDIIHPDDQDRVWDSIQAAIESNEPFEIEYRIITKQSQTKWVWERGRCIKDSVPEILEGFITDVTERKQAEQKVRLSEEKFAKAFNTSQIIMGLSDIETGRYVEVSQAFYDILGFSKEEVIGEKSSNLLKLDQNFIDLAKPKLLSEGSVRNIETIVYNKQKEPVHLLVSAEIINAGGKDYNFTSAIDISDRFKYIAELKKAKEKAEESDRLKSAFLTNMSHEIRTPMNGILGFTDLLREPELTGEAKMKYINVIQKSGDRMLNTINDIIDISKIESGLTEITLKEVNVKQVALDLYEFFAEEAKNKGLELTLHCMPPDNQALLTTDPDKLSSIITNLIKNALKFTTRGSVSFGYKKGDSQFEIFVKDTGIGVPADRRKAIFDRFVQADISDARVFEGSGLGLAITKSYVEMLGGKIWLESSEGVGTTFYVELPYQSTIEKSETIYQNEIMENTPAENHNLKILIAEDDETSLEHLTIILQNIAGEIITVNNGKDAVSEFQKHPDIDLILMDIKMPVMTGLVATEIIRQSNREIPIIAQTAYAQSGDSAIALEAGCNDYIAKPINKDTLMKMINQLLKK